MASLKLEDWVRPPFYQGTWIMWVLRLVHRTSETESCKHGPKVLDRLEAFLLPPLNMDYLSFHSIKIDDHCDKCST